MECTIEQLQQYELDMVRNIVSICDRHNILYFLHAGSALGAIRHGGPIPWDYDTDILVPENQIKDFIQFVSAELPDKYYLDMQPANPKYVALFPRVGLKGYTTEELHVDIFRMVGISSDRDEQMKLTQKAADLRHFFRTKLTPFEKCNFNAKIVKIMGLFVPRKYLIKKFDAMCNTVPFEKAEYVTNLFGKYRMKNVFKKDVYGKGVLVDYGGIKVRIAEQYEFYLKQYYGDYMKLPPEEERTKAIKKTYTVKEAK